MNGDIIFTQTLVRTIAGDNPIVWGVWPQFVEGLQRAYPDITWVDWRSTGIDYNIKQDIVIGDKRILPIRWADSILKVPYTDCMKAKYELYDMDWECWDMNAMWKPDILKEAWLMVGKVKPGEYRIINDVYRSDFKGKINIPVDDSMQNVYMSQVDGYSLFDWRMLLQYASEIHTVSTGLFYMLELLDIQCQIHLYPRLPEETNFKNIEYLFTKNYILHL